MRFRPTSLPGVLEILAEAVEDARGAFARTYCHDTFAAAGIGFQPCQVSLSESRRRHTLRGMHWQAPPAGEQKLVRCLRGAVHDVALDLRPGSATFGQSVAAVLSAQDGNALLIPAGCAHGFLTLTDAVLVEYMIDVPYAPEHGRGVRWDDPAFAICWPTSPELVSDRDLAWPDHG
jgi:dTDP-4-dehydrorhamnose 3,5-epimerase